MTPEYLAALDYTLIMITLEIAVAGWFIWFMATRD